MPIEARWWMTEGGTGDVAEEQVTRGVLQMRLVVEAEDYDEAVRFYRDVLGAGEELQLYGDDGEK